jgi:hypothetical protein
VDAAEGEDLEHVELAAIVSGLVAEFRSPTGDLRDADVMYEKIARHCDENDVPKTVCESPCWRTRDAPRYARAVGPTDCGSTGSPPSRRRWPSADGYVAGHSTAAQLRAREGAGPWAGSVERHSVAKRPCRDCAKKGHCDWC